MKRKFTSYTITGNNAIKDQVLNFGNKFSTFCFLDNHDYNFKKSYEGLAGVGLIDQLLVEKSSHTNAALEQLDLFKKNNKDWIFGHLCYDAKNEIEELSSSNIDTVGFPDLFFFVPEIVLIIDRDYLRIGVLPTHSPDEVYKEIVSSKQERLHKHVPVLKSRYSKKEYEETVSQLQRHISKGDCYEINFCQEFYATDALIDPLEVYTKLALYSPNPFSAFYKFFDKFLMCASPERFLKKEGDVIISQPIKGTTRRILNDRKADVEQKELLRENEKERSENIMIVDLVRNDLSKVCTEGSVKVEDFLGVYTFPQVHQMISTVAGSLKEDVKLSDIFRATFPMGSMTGAPKKRVMELIEEYEKTKRGLFSGTVGYIDPQGNFDFNVVIRSIQYNSTAQYVSVMAGSAITHNSKPELEYEECLLKITAMKEALQ